jgi:hypothetical protein
MSSITYNKLFTIRLMHEYYADNVCKDFIIRPTTSTQKLLRNYGILFKSLANGAVLLYEASDNSGTPKFPIDTAIGLRFGLYLQNPLFPNFTDVTFSSDTSAIHYFNNLNPAIAGQEHTIIDYATKISAPLPLTTKWLNLIKEDPSAAYVVLKDADDTTYKLGFNKTLDELKVDMSNYFEGTYSVQQYNKSGTPLGSSHTFYYNKDLNGKMPYALFEVFLDDSYNPVNPVTYLFNFKSRETIWRYNILKNEASPPTTSGDFDVAKLKITHEPDVNADKITFLADTNSSNPITFTSSEKVKFSEKSFDKIRLYKNSSILLTNLPNATADKLNFDGGSWVSDIYVYVYV